MLMQQLWTGAAGRPRRSHDAGPPHAVLTPHPMLFYGGGSNTAARRAARLDLPVLPQSSEPRGSSRRTRRNGHGSGWPEGMVLAPGDGPLNVFVSEDPTRPGPGSVTTSCTTASSYAQWQVDAGLVSVALDESETVEALRAGSVYAVLTPERVHRASSVGEGRSALHPLCGGIPPEVAWESLELLVDRVQPALD